MTYMENNSRFAVFKEMRRFNSEMKTNGHLLRY